MYSKHAYNYHFYCCANSLFIIDINLYHLEVRRQAQDVVSEKLLRQYESCLKINGGGEGIVLN